MATGRIGVTPTLGVRWSKAPAAGTTSLSGLDDNSVSLVYSVGYEQVYRNGVLLSRGNDYTATNGTTVTLTDATVTGDIIEIFANELVPLADAISKGQFTAKGSLLSASAASTPAVLAVGSNDQVLTADSSTATGLKWASPVSGSLTLLSTTTPSGASTTISGISQSYTALKIVARSLVVSTENDDVYLELNGATSEYAAAWVWNNNGTASAGDSQSRILFAQGSATSSNGCGSTLVMDLFNYTSTGTKQFVFTGTSRDGSGRDRSYSGGGVYYGNSAITSLKFVSASPYTFSSGTILVYGVN